VSSNESIRKSTHENDDRIFAPACACLYRLKILLMGYQIMKLPFKIIMKMFEKIACFNNLKTRDYAKTVVVAECGMQCK